MKNREEEAQALGFKTVAQCDDHAQWLEKYGSPEYKAWLKQTKEQPKQLELPGAGEVFNLV